jgi:hypothetical protein
MRELLLMIIVLAYGLMLGCALGRVEIQTKHCAAQGYPESKVENGQIVCLQLVPQSTSSPSQP